MHLVRMPAAEQLLCSGSYFTFTFGSTDSPGRSR